ncbi:MULTISPECIES: LysR family transcriptional regulator [Tenebrionibacter/Tenebrionicola group]|jgi:DNA-binding transcriptional LysR family regulator|uniref:LysR family transcriptional regulator n=2 Tax=Tenebrionibacter/Tenebrionicola group TaxID=2969848 RepID=A0A8K0V820_9ENTR|nr:MULTISPECIES: LysR family transcriptional regulator [Tenebrionibacter/Tenebrionicola group]MBK4715962.1 LysR family transcriptional regulator [Tenebrionibacter intestinalis]MBV4412087.1 LysR family transcriptional regulator [Tenebrionicola larvae]MBV5096860.1 LysR family transcriptional regulator [Tenebrionicola larvae]
MHSTLRGFDLNLLLVFDALLRTGSVTAAAQELSLSQPACSHALARMRRMLGDRLFVRSAGTMRPTPFARYLAPSISAMLHSLSGCLASAQHFDPPTSRHIFTCAATDYTGYALLPHFISRLQMQAPQMHINIMELRTADSLDDLRAGRIDFSLGARGENERLPADIHAVDGLVDEYVVMARMRHPVIGTRLTLERYLACRHIVVRPWHDEPGVIDGVLAHKGLTRQIALQLPTMLGTPFIVAKSDLVLTMPRHAALTFSHIAELDIFPVPFPTPEYRLRICSHSSALNSSVHRWVEQRLLDAMNVTKKLR